MSDHTGADEVAARASTLGDAERAFDRGDYRTVRSVCRQVIETKGEDAEKARDLLRRVSFDPIQAIVLAGCLVVFAVIVYVYVF